MKNIVKKVLMMILTMVIVSFFAFLAFQIIPGDPTTKILGSEATVEAVEALRAELGLDRPFFVRYFEWITGALQGDFGRSYIYDMSVAELLQGKMTVTLILTAIAFLMIVVLSIPLGIAAASRCRPWVERLFTVVGQVIMAVPPFFVGILLTLLCGLVLHWFNPGTFVSPEDHFWGSITYLLYPAFAIALPRVAMTVKMLKSSIGGEMNKDYVRTAYSRGNTRSATLYRHVLRNAVVPTVAFLAMTAADIVAGSVIIEQVFAISGIGRLLLTSISNRDFPVVQAIVVILALIVVLVNFLADLINQRLDPRLHLQ